MISLLDSPLPLTPETREMAKSLNFIPPKKRQSPPKKPPRAGIFRNKCKNCDCSREDHELEQDIPDNYRPIRKSDIQTNGTIPSQNPPVLTKDGDITVNFSLQMNHNSPYNDPDDIQITSISQNRRKHDSGGSGISDHSIPSQNGEIPDRKMNQGTENSKRYSPLNEFQQLMDELVDFENKVCEPNPHSHTVNVLPPDHTTKSALPTAEKKKSRRRRRKAPQRGSASDDTSSSDSEDEREKRRSYTRHDDERKPKQGAVRVKMEDSIIKNKKKSPQKLTSEEIDDLAQEFAWIPSGLSKEKVRAYMDSLPSDKAPRLGTPGEDYHDRQLLYQLPPQDSNMALCQCVPENLKYAYSEFVEKQRKAQGPGIVEGPLDSYEVCLGCREAILTGELAVRAPKFDENAFWHTRCFCCSTCGELLVDLIYYNSNGKIYCGRHNAETFKPRCADCEELIFADSYIRALNKTWHFEHFKCGGCSKTITGQEYIVFENQALCVGCYYHQVAKVCSRCNDKIGPDSKKVTNGDRYWHEQCFLCEECHTSLTTDGKFTVWEEKILCIRCHKRKSQVKKCQGCDEVFKPGSSRLEYSGCFWHEDCFTCQTCGKSIGTQAFVPKDDGILCQDCYTNQFAKRCSKCREPVVGSGVMYNDETWHRKCFVCFNCGDSIASCEFSVRNDNKFCAECYAKLFAKVCEGCGQAIIGGEYCRLEETYYHKDCFVCCRCNTSLVERGFYREDDEYICDACLDF